MRLGLIMTWVSMYFNNEFQYKPGPPFSRVPGNVVSTRTSPPGPPEGLSGRPDIIPPLFIKLVLLITSPPLNRFLRFQLSWIPFERTLLSSYYTSRYVHRIPGMSM